MGFFDQLAGLIVMNRHGDPLGAPWCFDLIAVTPVTFRVLYIVVNNEQIHFTNEIEVSPPGQEIGLYGTNFHTSTC
jgi:hypothetical protein